MPADYWPNSLFDTREGLLRDVSPSATTGIGAYNYYQMVSLGGVMQYVELDAKNVARYLSGALPGSGHLAYDPVNAPNDYTVYISDRRGNYTSTTLTNAWPPLSFSSHETGEYGSDDFVNPASAYGCPNSVQDTGEDLDGLGASASIPMGEPNLRHGSWHDIRSPELRPIRFVSPAPPATSTVRGDQCPCAESKLHRHRAFHDLAVDLRHSCHRSARKP